MMKFTILVSLICLSQIVNGFPNGQQPQTLPDINAFLTNLQKEATQAVATLNTRFLDLAGVKSNEEFVNNVNNQTQVFATQVKSAVTQLEEQAKTTLGQSEDPIKQSVQGVLTKLQESISTAVQSNPQAQQVTENLQASLRTVLDQANSLLPTLQEQGKNVQDGLRSSLEKLFETTKETAQKVAIQVDQAIQEKKSS